MTIETKHGVAPAPDTILLDRFTPRRVAICIAIVVLGFLYFSGRMDHALYPVGLNYNNCARNALGATFCGKELREYEQRTEQITRQVEGFTK